MQIDAEIVGQHELDPAHHVPRAGQLPHVHQQAARGDGAPVDTPRIERAGIVRPVGEDLETLVGDHVRAMRDGVARPLAYKVRRQVPVRVERSIADQPRHLWSRHRLLADDHAHRVADAPVVDHPQPCGGGVDQHVAPLYRRDRPRPLDIGEDQALIISRAPVKRGDGCRIGAAGDGQAVHLLELAKCRHGIGTGREAESLAQLVGPVRSDLNLGQASPMFPICGEPPDKAVIGGIAGQGGAGEVGGRRRGRERVEEIGGRPRSRSEARIDIAHRAARWRAVAVAGRVEKCLAQHHVRAEARAPIARPNRVERIDDIGPRGEQIEQGLVGALGPHRLEIPFCIEGNQLGRRREGGGRRSHGRARWRGRGRRAVGRDGPETDREAGSAEEAGQRRHAA